jgi:hypothetical protein
MSGYPMRSVLLWICQTEAVTESLVGFPVMSQGHRRACHQLVFHESRIDIILYQTFYLFPCRFEHILHRGESDISRSVDSGSQIL